jgi:GntR family transcriptional regulator of arabinose operon
MGKLYKKVYLDILEEINNGTLKIGDKIPSENELAEKFDVSRITTKRALDMLAQRNIIERYRGKGSYVANVKPDTISSTVKESEVSLSDSNSKTDLVGFILPGFGDDYGSKTLEAIEKRCSEHNLCLVLKQTSGKPGEEEKALNSLVNFGVRGLIFCPVPGIHYNNALLRLVVENYPLVLVDRYLTGIPSSSVCINNKMAAIKLTNHLLELGHKNIAFLSPSPEGTSSLEDRLMGFHVAISEKGLRIKPKTILKDLICTLQESSHNSPRRVTIDENDRQRIRKLIEDNSEVTAFIATEYMVAVLLYEELVSLGKKVPEDYSIACFDSPTNIIEVPFFTHILQDEEKMGYQAVDLLVSHLQENDTPPIHAEVGFTLVKGRSTQSI